MIVQWKTLCSDSKYEPCYHEKTSGKTAHHLMYAASFHVVK